MQERRSGGDDFAAVAEVEPPVTLVAQFIVKDGTRLELLQRAPKPATTA